MNQTNRIAFSGTVSYFEADGSRERAATLNVTYELRGNTLLGEMRFRGHETWEASLDFREPMSHLPEPWELKAGIRDFLRQYFAENACTYKSLNLS